MINDEAEAQERQTYNGLNLNERLDYLFESLIRVNENVVSLQMENKNLRGQLEHHEQTTAQSQEQFDQELRLARDELMEARKDAVKEYQVLTQFRNPASGGNKVRIQVSPPKEFSGDAEQVEGFLADCFLNYTANPTVYSTEMTKISYALSHIKGGTAATWKDNVVQAMKNNSGVGAFQTSTMSE
jgi:regulator of replication initiation timing